VKAVGPGGGALSEDAMTLFGRPPDRRDPGTGIMPRRRGAPPPRPAKRLEVLIDYLGSQYTECLEVDDDEELPEDLDEFWKNRYREACRPLYALVPPADIAAPHAVAWAVEAGYAPSVEAVEAVLEGGDVFAESQFFKPLAALGLPALTGAGTQPA
jgi:hypothetical protein